ncbi:MAG: SDR family oxidoreductase [Candidatus Omnitrophica bacterium]|nr:SDR family oxidoreductase [Candidatus Omnitrophota bacterium]
MKKVLVTGSMGYLGSRLAGYLRERDYDVLGFDTGFFEDGVLFPVSDPPTVKGDMRDFDPALLKGVTAVVHLAAMSNDPFGNLDVSRIYDPTRVYARNMARLCKERGIKFIFPSSCSIYGAGMGDRLLDESGPFSPQTPYSSNKMQVEEDVSALADPNFRPILLRLATVYGISPRLRFDLVINMLAGMAFLDRKIILNSDGKAWRPNVHIDDVCEAFVRAIEHEPSAGKGPIIVNVGDTSQNFQIIDLARTVQAQFDGCEIVFLKNLSAESKKDVELIRDRKVQDGVDTRTYKVSFEKIKETFPGFRCRYTVASGAKQLAEHFAALPLRSEQFKSYRYYRLQKIEHLHKTGIITDDLRFRS